MFFSHFECLSMIGLENVKVHLFFFVLFEAEKYIFYTFARFFRTVTYMKKSYIIAFLISCVSIFCVFDAQAQVVDESTTICDEVVYDRDNNPYPTVSLAGHCWMLKNLAVTSDLTSGVYAYKSLQFPDETGNVAAHGRLYDEVAVMQDICPEGWSLPTTTLFDYVKSHYTADELRNTIGWINGGTNITGFSWDASGMRNGAIGRFESMYTEGCLWAVDTTGGVSQPAMYKMMYYCNEIVRVQDFGGISASVRCVKDGGELPPEPEPEPIPEPTPEPQPETFSCGTSKIMDASGNRYETVQIGEQCWTKTNLRTTKFRNGGTIAENQDASSHTASYYRPAASDAVAEHYPDSVYGMYYNGYAVAGDTLCPEGWHVPTKAEWEQLTTYMGGQSDYICNSNPDYIAKALAGTHHYTNQSEEIIYAWKYEDKNCAVGSDRGTNNASGFSAFPAGYWENTFQNYGNNAHFWTPTPEDNQAWAFSMSYSEEIVRSYKLDKEDAISVRCLKDAEQEPQPETFSCGTSQMIDASGNHYETVKIGGQCWTKTNLRTTKFRNGNPVPEDVDPDQSSSASFSRVSSADVLPDIPTYTDSTFGFYYNWYAAADTGDSKLCPEGWHVSNEDDWTMLKNYTETYYYCGTDPINIAKALADSLLWAPNDADCSIGKNPENNNASGFSAVPAGYLSYGTSYPMYAEVLANFWIAKPSTESDAMYYLLSRYFADLEDYTNPKSALLSVRCVNDEEYQAVVLPTVTTDSATKITPTSAKLYGTVTNPDNLAVTEMGFEWKKNGDSEYASTAVEGAEFTTTLGNLTPSTKYFYRAFIKYDNRTTYGAERSFTTPIASVTTDSANHVALTEATIYGTVINPNHVDITEKGFLWKKSHGVYEYETVNLTGEDTALIHSFTDLVPNTKYDYKAFIKFDNRTVYGEELSFTTPNHPEVSCGTMTDADGNLYQTVKVGSQCWTKTNLRTTKYRKGSTISNQIGTTVPAYYRLSDLDKDTSVIVSQTDAPDSIFGFYYNGYAAVRDSLCPAGWHVPSYDDWSDFIGYLKENAEYWCDNDNSNLAKAVASRDFWFNVETPPITYTINNDAVARPCSPQYQGPDYLNDASYFSAIPAGAWYDNFGGNIDTVTGLGGHEFDPGKDAHFWSSSNQPGSDSTGYFFRLGRVTYDVVALAYDALKYGRSVRCLRDALSVTTAEATGITSSSVTLKGTITNPHYVQQTISAQGFEWKVSGTGTYTSVPATGSTMSYNFTGLAPDTEYTYRAFVTTEEGTFYGREVKCKTLVP